MKTFINGVVQGLILIILTANFTSCQDDDYLVITAQEPSEGIMFISSFSTEYLLSSETQNNIAERFVWNVPDFGVPTPINFKLEGATSPNFEEVAYDSGVLTSNNHAVKVGALLTMAEALGLDNDPKTTDELGEPNSNGTVYFRIQAFVGNDGAANNVTSISDSMPIEIAILEMTDDTSTGIELSSWGVVGSATANGWDGPDQPFYTTTDENVLVAYLTLQEGEVKFRENNEWTNNFGDTGSDGTLDAGGDNIAVTAGAYRIIMNFNTNTYTIEPYSWGVAGSATINGWDGPDMPLTYDYLSDTWKTTLDLTNGEIKFRLNNNWEVNFGDDEPDGVLESGGANIAIEAGNYTVTLDLVNLKYSLIAN